MPLVELKPLLTPETIYDLRYATAENITGQALYPPGFQPRLEEVAARALARASKNLKQQTAGTLRFKIWDAYRPKAAHAKLLEVCDDPNYVLDIETSRHPKGLAADLTLARSFGTELDMGTNFDHFGQEAHVDFPRLGVRARLNRQLLAEVMKSAGFRQLPTEWWHFDYVGR